MTVQCCRPTSRGQNLVTAEGVHAQSFRKKKKKTGNHKTHSHFCSVPSLSHQPEAKEKQASLTHEKGPIFTTKPGWLHIRQNKFTKRQKPNFVARKKPRI